MKDFAKSIRTGNEYKPGSYDPKRHEINLWKLDNEISKWSRTVSTLKQQIAGLERMVSSGEYSKLTNEELKRAKRDQEAAYMRLKQALSMKKRATGNSCVENEATVLKDGNVWVVLYANETKSQEFETEEEAREFAKKVGNSRVGNKDYKYEYKVVVTFPGGLADPEKIVYANSDEEAKKIALKYTDDRFSHEGTPKIISKKETGNSKVGNESNTLEEAKTKDEYFKILKFYQTQGYRTKAGEYNPNGRIKLHKGDDSVEIVLVGNSRVGNEDNSDLIRAAKKRLEDAKKFGWAETGYNGWTKKDVEDLEKKIKELEQKQKTGNSKVGNDDTYERLNEAIKTARAYSYNAYTRMASPFSSISIINDLSKCKEACDEAIKLVKQYDKERYN